MLVHNLCSSSSHTAILIATQDHALPAGKCRICTRNLKKPAFRVGASCTSGTR